MRQELITQRKGLKAFNTDKTKSKIIPFKKALINNDILECEKFNTNIPAISLNTYEGEEFTLNSSSLNIQMENGLVYNIDIEYTLDSSNPIITKESKYIQMINNKLVFDNTSIRFAITYVSSTNIKLNIYEFTGYKNIKINSVVGYKIQTLDKTNLYSNKNKSLIKRTKPIDLIEGYSSFTLPFKPYSPDTTTRYYSHAISKNYLYLYYTPRYVNTSDKYNYIFYTNDTQTFNKLDLPGYISSLTVYEDHICIKLSDNTYYVSSDEVSWEHLTQTEYETKYPKTSTINYSSLPSRAGYSTYYYGYAKGLYYRQNTTGSIGSSTSATPHMATNWSSVEYSTDNVNWKQLATSWQFNGGKIEYHNGIYITSVAEYWRYRSGSASWTSVVKYSRDGINWYNVTGLPSSYINEDNEWVYGIGNISGYINGTWYAFSDRIDGFYFSTDGINWVRRKTSEMFGESLGLGVKGLRYEPITDKLYMYLENGNLYESTDGLNFIPSDVNASIYNPLVKAAGYSTYEYTSLPKFDSNNIFTQYNYTIYKDSLVSGKNYQVTYKTSTNQEWTDIVTDIDFYADPREMSSFNGIGFSYTTYYTGSSDSSPSHNYYSIDGINWYNFKMPKDATVYGDYLQFKELCFGNNSYLMAYNYRQVYFKPFKEVIPGYCEVVV